MDAGSSPRAVSTANLAPVRVLPPVERQAVASELPETQAVVAAAEDAPVRFHEDAAGRDLRAQLNAAMDRKAEPIARQTVQQVVQDDATKELVFRKVRADTGQVVGQFPEEAMLRLKAYNAQVRREAIEAAERQTA
jgi:uncharacterized FlaG/YvyC family protein